MFKKTIGSALLLAALSLSACSVPEPLREPPELSAVAGSGSGSEVDVPTEISTYNWGGEMTYGGPRESMADEEAVTVPAGSKIVFSFAPEAPDKIRVWLMTGSSPFKEIESTEASFDIPDQPGEYVYGINGKWMEGSALYALKVRVRD